MALRYLAVTVAVVALIAAGAYAPAMLGAGTAGSGTSTTCTTAGSSTSSAPPASVEGSFTYSPAGPVKVESVSASTYPGGNGTTVTFAVAFENVGTSDIYTVAGCGSSLAASLPQGDGALKRVTGGPVCLCAEAPTAVPPGEIATSVTPGCWTVYKFLLVGPGTVQVDLALYWGPSQSYQRQDSTNITATFTFG